jgi:hypothetical protein
VGVRRNARQLATSLNIVEWRLSDDRLVAAFDWVAERIPDEDLGRFPDLELIEVAQTTCGANVGTTRPGVMQIQLAPTQLIEMTNGSAAALAGLIAHELAHAFFRHPRPDAIDRDGLAEEHEADAKAREWVGNHAVDEFRGSVGPPATGEWQP